MVEKRHRNISNMGERGNCKRAHTHTKVTRGKKKKKCKDHLQECYKITLVPPVIKMLVSRVPKPPVRHAPNPGDILTKHYFFQRPNVSTQIPFSLPCENEKRNIIMSNASRGEGSRDQHESDGPICG